MAALFSNLLHRRSYGQAALLLVHCSDCSIATQALSLSAGRVVPRYEALYRLVGSSIRLLD